MPVVPWIRLTTVSWWQRRWGRRQVPRKVSGRSSLITFSNLKKEKCGERKRNIESKLRWNWYLNSEVSLYLISTNLGKPIRCCVQRQNQLVVQLTLDQEVEEDKKNSKTKDEYHHKLTISPTKFTTQTTTRFIFPLLLLLCWQIILYLWWWRGVILFFYSPWELIIIIMSHKLVIMRLFHPWKLFHITTEC